jgi:MYXO-CTERM domain-containing protein
MHAISSHTQRFLGSLLAVATFLCLSLGASPASAADRVVWKKTKVNESNSSWNLDLEFHMSKPPDIAHVPMQFKFEPDIYYERSLVDGNDAPQERKVPLENKQPLIESVEVGFLDPRSGKTQARTRFSFKLTRDRGFEAGEYKVTVTHKGSGKKLGTEQRLTLSGENEVIDRRSMVFDTKKADEKAKAKREAEAAKAEEQPDPSQDPNSEEYWASGPSEPEAKEADLPPPAHLQENPGACGCRVPGEPARSKAPLGLLALLGLVWLRRSRA